MEAGTGTVTIDAIDDGEVTLDVNPDTEIEDPIAVGDFVKAKYNHSAVAISKSNQALGECFGICMR